jgi:DNA polymerase I
MSKDLLLDVDYITVDEKAQIRLFMGGRTLYDRDFQPYLYVATQGGEAEEELSVFGSVERVTRSLLGEEKQVLKLTVAHPSEVPKLREELRNMDIVSEIYEHDILFSRRYLIDNSLTPLNYAEFTAEEGVLKKIDSTERQEENLRVMAFDIEVYNPKGAPRPSVDPIIMLSYASSTGKRGLLTWKDADAPDYVAVVEDEKTVLTRFTEIVEKEGIDILVGYNSDQFDIPYIMDRAKAIGVNFPLGRLGLQPSIRKGRGLTESVVRGRPHVDLYPVVRRNVKLSSYVLENVVLDVLGIEKEKIPSDLMWQYWDRGGAHLRAFMQYSTDDVDVPVATHTRGLCAGRACTQ